MRHEVDTIIFDFDGVLIDSGKDIADAVNYTLRHFEKGELSIDEIISYIGNGIEHLVKKSFKDSNEETIKEAIRVLKQYYLEHCANKTKLYPNVLNTLNYFKDKNMAVVTNKPQEIAIKILQQLGVMDYFKMVLGPESVKNMKPDPEGLNMVINTFTGQPDMTLMVGDSYSDVQAGKACGTLTCGVTYGLGSTKEIICSSPDLIIDDIKGLTEVIE